MKAKKSYGQHFLKNNTIAQAVADSLVPNNFFSKVLEIGPGRGMLTQYLLKKDYELMVVEADKDMVLYVQKYFPALKGKIISADFLQLDLKKIFGDDQFALIGNFPYNISSQILFKMLDFRYQVPVLVGMFQLEMARRVVAPPGSKTYGVISVLIQAYYEGELLFEVDKDQFIPPPKVQSAVIRLTRKENMEIGCDEALFKKIVKAGFSQRRKMLRNTMKNFVPKEHPLLREDFFDQRPERLSVSDFVKLTNWIADIQQLN